MSKNIGIITFQNANNYGAVLQAFALQTVLSKLGNNVKIINYDSEKMNLKKVQSKLFSDFNFKYLNLTSEYYKSYEILTDEFDLVIAGSDQIWNPLISGGDVAYFFKNCRNSSARIASYAASIGLTGDNLLPYGDFFRENLKDFSGISIRESNQKSFLEKLLGCEVNVNVDPTLLLNKKEYEDCFNISVNDGNYIFLYTNNVDAKIVDFVNLYSKVSGMKIISVSKLEEQMFNYGTQAFYKVAPSEWLRYLAGASLVVTDSFHGLMFSLIFEKPFYSYTKNYANSSRIINVLENCNLRKRTLKNLGTVQDVCLDVDFSEKRKFVEKEQEKSLIYLKGLL